MIKIYSNVELAKFSPRQLMEELKARGFRWDYMLEPQKKIYFEKI
jgi:predicted HTH domain antitoxin